jgi:hypothetical protein
MIKRLIPILVVMVMVVAAVVPVLVQADTASACGIVGLSPGYWKNHTAVWDGTDPEWDGPLPGAYFDVVFGVVGHQAGSYVAPHKTLLEVLNTGGGKFDALNRAAVAALLNSYWLDSETSSWYYYSAWYIKTHVHDAYHSGDWQSLKADFEATYD